MGATPQSRTALPRLIRKTVLLVTVVTSIGPSNGIDSLGPASKPSSVLRTARSSQSDWRTVQSEIGRSTRRPVLWLESAIGGAPLTNHPTMRNGRAAKQLDAP